MRHILDAKFFVRNSAILLMTLAIWFFVVPMFHNFRDKAPPEGHYKYTALMIESRDSKAVLELVVDNFAENLDKDDWQIFILHGKDNAATLRSVVQRHNINGRMRLFQLDIIDANFSVAQYNSMFYSEDFYENYVPTETFLIFQSDTLINADNRHLLQPFFRYDYVGAPWSLDKPDDVGNGGLSLRKKSKMLEILKKCNHLKWNDKNVLISEDKFFSFACPQVQEYVKPKPDYAKHFSVGHVFAETFWGTHKTWRRLKKPHPDQYEKLLKIMPLIGTLEKLHTAMPCKDD